MPTIKRREAAVEMATGDILEVRVINADVIRYEQHAHRMGWPGLEMKDGTAMVNDSGRRATYEVWAALTRTGQYAGDFNKFLSTDCVDLAVEEVEVGPTRPALDSDSSQNSPGTESDPSRS